jgi:hypothetical protein
MMMDRRAFSTALLAGAATSLTSARGMAANATPTKASKKLWLSMIARLRGWE